jgi:type IV pilus assembly protein PilC
MPTFEYVARDNSGALVRGRVEAQDDARARAHLQRTGLFLTSLRARRPIRPAGGAAQADVAVMTFHLAMLLGAGLPLSQALGALAEQTEDAWLRAVVDELTRDIAEGRSLSDALGRRPDLFGQVYVGMVRNGELTGRLDEALGRLAEYMDRDLEIRKKIREALLYPAIVLSVAACVLAVFLTFIIPAFDRVYKSAGASLPLVTRTLMAASRSFRAGLPFAAAAGVIVILPPSRRLLRAALAVRLQRLVLRLPRVGALAKSALLSRFARALGIMLRSGVPIVSALDVAGAVVGLPDFGSVVDRLKRQITEGHRFADAMRETGWFTPMIIQMTSLGEESGRLDVMLDRAASVLERDFDLQMRRFFTLLEPALTLVVGGIVGILLVALYLPIFGLAKAVVH